MLTLSIQYALYHVLLRGALQSREVSLMRPAVGRWLKVVLLWEVLVVVVSASYIAVLASSHARGYAWAVPAVGAVFGTALPLQLAAVAILRAGRPS